VGGRDDVSLERLIKFRWRTEWHCFYSCCREDDHDLVVPLEIQGSDENLHHLPWKHEKNLGKTLDEEEKKEAAEEESD
jgi:hypothetical protein